MKAFLPPCLILAALLALSLWNSAVVADFTGQCASALTAADQQADAGDWDAADRALRRSYALWSRRQTYLHVVVRHEEIDNAEAMYRRARAFLETQEPSEFRAEVADLKSQLRLLAEMEEPSIKNVL